MTHEEFDKLVQRVESGVGRDTRALYKKIFRLALLGYAGLCLPLVLVVVISLACFVPGILWPQDAAGMLVIGAVVLVLGGWATGRMLWVRIAAPEGRAVTRTEAPGLFAELDELRGRLKSEPFDSVLVVPEFNAAFAHRPRLGVFGWNRTYLLAGLPLMESLSREQFIAVLAHECAHLSRRHHRSGQWVYRLRRSWELVFGRLSRPRHAREISMRPLARKFIDWFWPRFNAYAFVLSRAHEYQADATSAELAGMQNTAAALVRIGWLGRVLNDKLWPELWRSADANPAPPAGVFSGIACSLNAASPATEGRWLEQAFRSATTNADTHPCLSDRLRALGGDELVRTCHAAPPARAGMSAAEAMLGSYLGRIREDVEKQWLKQAGPKWLQMHQRAGLLSERMDKLDATITAHREDVDAMWDKARVFLDLRQPEAAAPLLRDILAIDPRHAAANFNLGAFLLKSGDGAGEQFLERAVAENEEALPQAANLLHAHYRSAGQSERIRELYARMDRYEKEVQASRQERSNVTTKDKFIPHDLTEAELEGLRGILAGEPDVIGADLAQKELRYFAKQKLYLLCVRVRPAWHRLPDADRARKVVDRLVKAVHLPGRVLIFAASGDFRGVGRKVRKVAACGVYRGQAL